jgi:hypothetical protein
MNCGPTRSTTPAAIIAALAVNMALVFAANAVPPEEIIQAAQSRDYASLVAGLVERAEHGDPCSAVFLAMYQSVGIGTAGHRS